MKTLHKSFKNVSLSHGTMREEDLLPIFSAFIKVNAEDCKILLQMTEIVNRVESLRTTLNEYGVNYIEQDIERAQDCLIELFILLNNIAPDGCAFGSHEGDGSDYGFWEVLND